MILIMMATVAVLGYVMISQTIQIYRSRQDRSSRLVLVTGAASGIGRALCQHLLTEGDSLLALDVNEEGLTSLSAWAHEQRYAPDRLVSITCDLTDQRSVDQAVAQATERLRQPASGGSNDFHSIHAIVNLAGIYACGALVEEQTVQAVEKALRVNIMGTVRVTQAFFPLLPAAGDPQSSGAGHGRILIIGSEMCAAQLKTGLTAPYTMTKYALEVFAASLRQELCCMLDTPAPVHVCMVNPGPIRTDLAMEQPVQAVNSLVRSGSLWSNALRRLVATMTVYSDQFAIDAERAAKPIGRLIHAVEPPQRISINMTPPMRLVAWLPQSILDRQAAKKRLGNAFTMSWTLKTEAFESCEVSSLTGTADARSRAD
jgi:NAD(P)-dependent dehydrogenase (short-subunit alcohol dehydrogenase family)